MRYLIAVGIGIFAFLFLNGIQAVSVKEQSARYLNETVVYINTTSENADTLKAEVKRLQTLANIREVLEVNNSSASLKEKRELAENIFEACTFFDLDVELVLAVIKTESAFNSSAVSHRGARGLMQVMPLTGKAISNELALKGFEIASLFDSRTNVMLGCYYLKKLIKRYNSLDHALLAYNRGPTKFDLAISADKSVPFDYANKVKGNMLKIAELFFSEQE